MSADRLWGLSHDQERPLQWACIPAVLHWDGRSWGNLAGCCCLADMNDYDHYGYPASREDCRLYARDDLLLYERPRDMDINQAFPSKFLKAEDLQGREVELTIASCVIEQMGDGEHKPCLSFRGKEKALVLNKTNANAIIGQMGSDETNDWIGKTIKIYPTQVDFAGRQVAAIRVRVEQPDITPVAEGDDIPF